MRRPAIVIAILAFVLALPTTWSVANHGRHVSATYGPARAFQAAGPAECGADHQAVGPNGGFTRSTVRFFPARRERWVSVKVTDDLPGQTIVGVLWQPTLGEVHDIATFCGRTRVPIRIRRVPLHVILYNSWSTEGSSIVTSGVVEATFFRRLPGH